MKAENIVKLADEHIALYERRIASGSRFVRVDECQNYLSIWKSIKAKGGVGLSVEEASEVNDAIDSGEYDHLLESR